MTNAEAKAAYFHQKAGAKQRGIGFELSFEEWVAWWGDDIDRRGTMRDELQMCRKGDKGPYALGNIYKGTAQENHKTAANLRRNRAAERNKQRHQQYLDALVWAKSEESLSEEDELDENKMQILSATGAVSRGERGRSAVFAADKRR